MRFFILFILYLWTYQAKGQAIISRDTICANETVLFTIDTTYINHITYAWEFGTPSMTPILSTAIPVPGTGIIGSGPTGMFSTIGSVAMAYDNGNYHGFVTSARNFSLQRLDFGANPNGTPTITNLGNLGGAITSIVPSQPNMETIEIIKDNGQWYGFIIDKDAVIRVEFGTSITNNAPNAVRMSFSSVMEYGMQLTMLKFNNEWIGFCGNTGRAWWSGSVLNTNYIHRFDFGSSITNVPSVTVLPNNNLLSECYYFTLHEDRGNWHMLVANYYGVHGNSLARYDFGTNLKNNNPALTNLGVINGLNKPRAITTAKSCDTFFAVQLNENGTVNALDFNNDISNVPTSRFLGQVYGSSNMSTQMYKPYWYRDTLWLMTGNFSNLTSANIFRFPLLHIPSGNAVINHYDPSITYTFSTPGVYDVTVYCDQGDQKAPFAFCKKVVVLPGTHNFLGPDTVLCDVASYTLDATQAGATAYLWNTGETTPAITVTSTGQYSVLLSGILCSSSDTVQVGFSSTPVVDLGSDTLICAGDMISLPNTGTYINPRYLWNTGATTPGITVNHSGRYYLRVTDEGCSATDTIEVTVKPVPVVDLGPDTNLCESALPVTLRTLQPSGSLYRWSNRGAADEMIVTESGTYWLEVERNDCKSADTIVVTAIPDPAVYIGADSSICAQFPLRIGDSIPGASHAWSTGATTPYIYVSATDTYILSVNLLGCIVRDTISITAFPAPEADLGDDRSICPGQTITLDATHDDNSTYAWNTGETTARISLEQAGWYHVTITTEYGCSAEDSILVTAASLPVVSLGSDTTICEDAVFLMTPVHAHADSLIWSDGYVGFSRTGLNGTYIVTAVNPCGSDTDTISIIPEFCGIWIPNVFTPNGDGLNDIFRALGDLGRLQDFQWSIYNRWGEKIFHTHDKYHGWNGRYKETDAMVGTYVYLLTYRIGEQSYKKKGSFHLLR